MRHAGRPERPAWCPPGAALTAGRVWGVLLLCAVAWLPCLVVPSGGTLTLHTEGGDVSAAWDRCGARIVLGAVVVDTGVRSLVCQ